MPFLAMLRQLPLIKHSSFTGGRRDLRDTMPLRPDGQPDTLPHFSDNGGTNR